MKLRFVLMCLCAVVLLAAFVKPTVNYSITGSAPGPKILYKTLLWPTEVLDVSEDHNKFAIAVVVRPPEEFDPSDIDDPAELIRKLCSAVLADFERFNRFGILRDDLDHIDLNVRVGRQMAMRYDVTMYVGDGACKNSFVFDRADPAKPTASGHDLEDHIRANLLAWGLAMDDLKFSDGTEGKKIKVSYEVLSGFDREPETVDALKLCVLSLVSLDPKVSILGIEFSAGDYDVMEIEISRKLGWEFLSFSRTWGPAVLGIEDGKCSPITRD